VQRYKEIEHTADVGVEIYGETLEELFQNAGYALFDTIADITTVTSTVSRIVSATGDDIESLFFNWLRELLYLSSVHQEIYAGFDIHALQPTQLNASVKGELLDLEKHRFETEIKAVTYHQFAIIEQNGIWKARVIFDI
jgi:SHS2 domain-containing protein